MERYSIKRTNRRTLSMELKQDGSVLVRSPMGVSDQAIEKFVSDHQAWLDKHRNIQATRAAAHPEPSTQEAQILRQLASQHVPLRVDQLSRRMNLTPTGVKITSAKHRLGSCSGRNSLCFSWRLMTYPAAAIDYVIVHELAHIVHKNHGPAFYALIEKYLPNYRERRQLLRR